MKKYLGKLMAATFVILVAASNVMAGVNQNDGAPFNRKVLFEEFELCLNRSDVPGFVESTLYTIVQCKDRYPDWNYSRLLSEVNDVAKKNSSPSIRYKAYLVGMYLTHSDIQVSPVPAANEHDYLFRQIADQLEQKFLESHNNESVAENR